MKRKFAFRPTVTDLESRQLLSVAPYPDAIRTKIEASYVAQADKKDNPVVFLGDSITQYWSIGGNHPVGTFNATFGKLNAADFGIAGDNTDNLIYRIKDGDLNGKPKVIVLMIGVNNLLQKETPKQTAAGVASVLAAVHKASPNSKVLLLGLLPTNFATTSPYHGNNALVPKANTLIAKLANKPYITYRNPGTLFLEPDKTVKPGLLTPDIHPNAEGYKLIAGMIEPVIVNLLKHSK